MTGNHLMDSMVFHTTKQGHGIRKDRGSSRPPASLRFRQGIGRW